MKLPLLCLIFFFGGLANCDKQFEKEVFEKTRLFSQHFHLSKGRNLNAQSYVPERAFPLIDYAKRYFNEKTIMIDDAPKVSGKIRLLST